MLNFIAEVQGPARFRPGTVFAYQTRLGAIARAFDFEINDTLAYLLEFTPGYLRVRNPLTQALLTTTVATITSITKAATAVVTVASATGLANGSEIILSGLVGMPELNNKQFLIANLSGTTFNLADPVTAATLDTSAYPAAATSGTASKVYELTTPYSALDLQSLQAAATDGSMYFVCPRQVPYKLTVDAYGTFAISTYVRTNDPFAAATAALTVTDVRPIYVGDTRTRNAPATTITPAAVTGTGINFTASASIFTSADVGKYIELVGAAGSVRYGRAIITGFTSATVVICTILTDFNSTVAIPAGSWRIMTVETQVTLVLGSAVNASLTYTFSAVNGATQINGNTYYLVAFDDATRFPANEMRFILRTTGHANVDSTAWGVYSSAGTATPTSATSQPALTVTGITTGTSTIITFASGSLVNENSGYAFSGVVGTTEINGNTYFLKIESGVVHLVTSAGAEVDSSAWTAYVSGGVATLGAECPLAVAFYEGRLVFAGTNQRPDCLFLSRAPDDSGNSRYDDFTGGTAADFACFFQLAPTGGSASFISWARGGSDYLFVGTFGGPYRVSGSGLDIPITPSSINVRQFDTAGCEATAPAGLQQMFFVQRAGATLRSIKVINPYLATFESADMCLNAEQVGYSPMQRVVLQRGRPDILWVYGEDGSLSGMSVHLTVQAADTLTGWHRHQIGGVAAKVLDIVTVPRQTGFDQFWMVVQRTINGATRCYFELMADDVTFPDPEDFYGASGAIMKPSENPQNSTAGVGSKAADLALWANVVWRKQDGYIHMDSEVAYDGSLRGVAAGAAITPSAVGVPQVAGQAAVTLTLTASQSVFLATDVGSEIWVKPHATTGRGAGRVKITAYTSGTQVTAECLVSFEDTHAVTAGNWYFAVSTFYGFGHLEGSQVAVVADGAVVTDGGQTGDEDFPTITVTRGTITLPAGDLGIQQRAAVLRAGLPYKGIIETHNLEMGGRSGPAQAKPRSIAQMYIRFMNSLGCEYGTDLYNMDKVNHRLSDAEFDRPAPVFSGVRKLSPSDSWSGLDDATREKNVFVTQRLPLPAVVQFLDLSYDTADDGGGQ
jgi:hypothetical protein